MTQSSWRLRFIHGAAHSQNTRAEKEEAEFLAFVTNIVRPAFTQIVQQLAEKGRTVSIQETRAVCGLTVFSGSFEEIAFLVTRQTLPNAIIPAVEVKMHERRGLRIQRKTAPLRRVEDQTLLLAETTADDIVGSFFKYYEEALRKLT